ncbi:MAG: single-stranded-DNA-specific exonuclease RecJ [bacterium]|nr:single-stranded-DNA-specific exonuclease RecJ [bacterium]
MKRKWKIREKINEDIITKFPGFDPVILQLLHNRGLKEKREIENFFEPRYELLSSPYDLTDMRTAVEKIFEALAGERKIFIYADYDADAVTACAVLYRFLKRLGADVGYYIPDRFAEGYGMNADAVAEIADAGAKLLITVDCGINSVAEVDRANSKGMEVVITDHHEIIGNLPAAAAVINPKRNADLEDLQGLTGVGVAFKLVQALAAVLHREHYSIIHKWQLPEFESVKFKQLFERLGKKVNAHWEKWLLDLVAIGTIADCQSLMGENRTLVKFGLQVMRKTKWIGLREILKNSGTDLAQGLDTFTVAFIIAPRINAAGRIQHAGIACNLLITDDPAEAAMLAGQLESLNAHRQRLTEQIVSEARSQVLEQSGRKILLATGANWPKGVVGLVASRLTEEFGRPTIVLEQGEELATGSARSVKGFNIVEAFASARELLERFGGHAQAAGLTIKNEKIPKFYEKVLEYSQDRLTEENLVKEQEIDLSLEPKDITDDLVEKLKMFEPFGLGNPSVKFMLSGLTLEQLKVVGSNGKHLKLHAAQNGKIYEFIGFGHAKRFSTLNLGENLDFVVEPSFNIWNGRKKIQLKVKDLRRV